MKIENVKFTDVELKKGFFKDRYDLNKNVSIDAVYNRFKETDRIDAMLFHYDDNEKLHIYYDSDTAKWIEAVSYLIMKNKNGYKRYEKVIDEIAKAIDKNNVDGYLNSYFIQKEPEKIFKDVNNHELYCLGHVIEAAIAYDKATGKDLLLKCAKKAVDNVIKAFVTEKTANFHAPGHEEIEFALVKLYDYTGDKKYLDLSMHFLNARGKYPEKLNESVRPNCSQSGKNLRELSIAEGHAVRAVYLYVAMVEAGIRSNDNELIAAAKRIFADITEKKMYITGGIGSSSSYEGFTVDYDLPNLLAYSESCASIGMAMFCEALQKTELNSKYADVIERLIYNSMLSSTSLSGDKFFYVNPLEIVLKEINKETSLESLNSIKLPITRRQKVFSCSCCPPNINRIFARIGDFIYSEKDNDIIVNQFISSTLNKDGKTAQITTKYPQNGKINVKTCGYNKIYIRKPFWCDDFSCDKDFTIDSGYIVVSDSEVNIEFKIKPYFVEANPNILYDYNKVALMRGPVVYCAEGIDNVDIPTKLSVDIKVKVKEEKNGFIPNLIAVGYKRSDFSGLYRKATNSREKIEIKFIPYYTFANREETDMSVFIERS